MAPPALSRWEQLQRELERELEMMTLHLIRDERRGDQEARDSQTTTVQVRTDNLGLSGEQERVACGVRTPHFLCVSVSHSLQSVSVFIVTVCKG
jgi:hypothetical protein